MYGLFRISRLKEIAVQGVCELGLGHGSQSRSKGLTEKMTTVDPQGTICFRDANEFVRRFRRRNRQQLRQSEVCQ